jgi:thiol:disulfide interchange protein DsbD
MTTMSSAFSSFALAGLLAFLVAAQTPAPRRVAAPHTVVEFIVDRQPDASTRELWAGLRFELEQGWHVYWQNPGDSGGPPTLLWQPPRGVVPGEFEWPLPERIPLGPLINYGYTNEVVLPFPLRVDRPLQAGGVALEAQVKWLICSDICIPGQTRLSLALPLPESDRSRIATWRQQIQDARARVPGPAPAPWRMSVASTGTHFVLTVRMDEPATGATFYPLETSRINDAAAQTASAKGNELVLRLEKSPQLTSEPRQLRGVLALPSGGAFVITAPVSAAGAKD